MNTDFAAAGSSSEAYSAILDAGLAAGKIYFLEKNSGKEPRDSKKAYAAIKKTCEEFKTKFNWKINTSPGTLNPTVWPDKRHLSTDEKTDLKRLWKTYSDLYPARYKKMKNAHDRDVKKKKDAEEKKKDADDLASSLKEAKEELSRPAASVSAWGGAGLPSGSSSLLFSNAAGLPGVFPGGGFASPIPTWQSMGVSSGSSTAGLSGPLPSEAFSSSASSLASGKGSSRK